MRKLQFKFGGIRYNVDVKDAAGESVLAEIFKYREYRRAEKTIISAKEPVVDAGAHLGLFAIYVRSLNPRVKILALEPDSANFTVLKENLKNNKIIRVETIEMALAAQTGRRKMLLSADSHNHRLIGAGEESDQLIEPVKAISFSDLCKKFKLKSVSLFKMDVEGAEKEIIESLSPEDYSKIRSIVLEYHDSFRGEHKHLEQLLRENGFGPEVFLSKFDKSMGFIFARNKRFKEE